jgi:hypothetical protein
MSLQLLDDRHQPGDHQARGGMTKADDRAALGFIQADS